MPHKRERHRWVVKVSQMKTPAGRPASASICLVGKTPAQKRQLKRLRKAFESGMRMVVGHGIKGNPYLLWYLEVPDGKWKDGRFIDEGAVSALDGTGGGTLED